MNQDKKVVKISEVIENQIPEFILNENPNFFEFLKQYYISQEYQGSTIDLAENLISYKNIDSFDTTNLIQSTQLSSDVDFYDDQIFVNSTYGWPGQYGLLKIDNEIITYTGITTNSFTGCIRGFSGVESLSNPNSPENLVFSSTEVDSHISNSKVSNLSNLFLLEFLKKAKYQFTPGFEDLDFDSRINIPNFISRIKDFYRSKGTDEAFKILFKVLYGKNVEIIKPKDHLFTLSDDQWIVVESFICELINGDPLKLNGQTLYQDENDQKTILSASGSIYDVNSIFLNGNQYYKVNIFSGYSNNLNPKGSISGEFKVTPKTYCDLNVESGSTTINVVSTIGFDLNQTLLVNGHEITYTDKTSTEFLNCSGITTTISSGTAVYANNFVYSYENGNTSFPVKLRILNTLSSIDVNDAVLSYEGDVIKIDNLGILKESVFTQSLKYNVPSIVFAGEVFQDLPPHIEEGVSFSNGLVRTKYNPYLKNDDIVEVYDYTTGENLYDSKIENVNSGNEFTITPSDLLKIGHKIKLKRKVFRSKSNSYPEVNNKFVLDVQNSFEDRDNYYIISNGFPNTDINPHKRSYNFEVVPSSGYLTLSQDHNFYTGEVVKVESYQVSNSSAFKNTIGITTGGSYYVLRINEREIRLSTSQDQLKRQVYVNFSESTNGQVNCYVTNLRLELSKIYDNPFTSSKTLKKIPKVVKYPIVKEETIPGSVGFLVNGLEIRNYKSFDKVYNGQIESVDVLSPGSGYDLLNPPKFEVDLGNDSFTSLIPQMNGKLEEIIVTDPGYDYVEVPIVTISGGNNKSVRTEVKMKSISKEIDFDAGDINTVVTLAGFERFQFNSSHRLINGDSIIYQSFGNPKIGVGDTEFLIDNSVYYVSQVGYGTSFRLANNKTDAINETNLLTLRSLGKGLHRFTSTKKVKVIDSVNIIDTDLSFKYKKLLAFSNNINHYDNVIEIKNHGFSNNEEIIYSFKGSILSGLSTTTYYYVVKVDENKFKLSSSETEQNIVNFQQSNPSDIHFFGYSPIRVNIQGRLTKVGLSTIGYSASLVPIVRGSINGVLVEQSNVYGHESILNYEDYPNIEVLEGKNSSIGVLVDNGRIKNTIIFNQGYNYYNSIELKVIGKGYGAVLYPVISNGKIVDVKIINSGIGYDEFTRVEIKKIGKELRVKGNIKSWTLNECSKYSQDIINSGILIGNNYHPNRNSLGIYTLTPWLYTLFGITTQTHSPIIGWAHDGCPIYGPYAFENVNGTGRIVQMASSYKKVKNSTPLYEFVEDYQYEEGFGTLDEHNGRYCVTPEFPNGVYAYFATLTFPYFIGNTYNYVSEKDNYKSEFNQNLDLNTLNIVKHTFPYYVKNKQNYYDYFDFYFDEQKNIFTVKQSSLGTVDSIKVVSPGQNYLIGDSVLFDNTGTSGFGAIAKVNELNGVGISSINSTNIELNNFTIISDGNTVVGISTISHNLKDKYYVNISGISTTSYQSLIGYKQIGVSSIKTFVLENLNETLVSGIVTSIKVQEPITSFEIDSELKINTETVKVIGLDYTNNRLNILRQQFYPEILKNSEVNLLQTKFTFKSDKILNLNEKDEVYYFRSSLVSLGTSTAVGVGNTLTLYPLGIGVSESKYVRTAGIWMPNHRFRNGDRVTYIPYLGDSTVQTNYNNQYLNDFSELYIVDLGNDIVGLTTQKNKTASTDNLLYFISSGTGNLHKLKTNRNIVTANLNFNETVVSTASSHGLSVGDVIKLDVISGVSTQFIVDYNSSDAKLRINSTNNPKLNVYRNSTVEFDISSGTLSGTNFKLYVDENYKNEYVGSGYEPIEITRDSSKLILKITPKTPDILYYNIESSTKKVYDDISVNKHNTIEVNDSLYNKTCGVVTTTSNTFTVNLPFIPESNSYVSVGSTILTYSILKSNISGPIKNIDVLSGGYNYKKLPSIIGLNGSGKNAKIIPQTNTIGKIKDIFVNSTSIFSTDKTNKPISNLYSTVYLTDNYQVKDINLVSKGENYLSPPKVYLYNSESDSIVSSFSAFAELKGSSIDKIIITNKGNGLTNNSNKVIFTENSNGIRILGVSKNQVSPETFRISLTLETPVTGFTTSNPLDFQIGDKIFVENILSLGNGYNCSDYFYETFELVGIVTNYSGQNQSILRYEVSGDPGTVISLDSAYVINAKYLPEAEVLLETNEFISGEPLKFTNIIDNTKDKSNLSVIKVYDSENLNINETIKGKYSLSEGKVLDIVKYDSNLSVNSSVSRNLGWSKGKGDLSEVTQKLQDNDYYQNFSYSLKSDVEIKSWNSPVSDLCHIVGLKKFSDLNIESKDNSDYNIIADSYSPINVSIYTYNNINTTTNFDLVIEDVEDHQGIYSEILKFKNKKLTDYILSKENLVLSIDDIKSNFNDDEEYTEIIIDTQPTFNEGSLSVKYIVFIEASKSIFTDYELPLFVEIFMTRLNDQNINITSYSYFQQTDLGNFIADVNPDDINEIRLKFVPLSLSGLINVNVIKSNVSLNQPLLTTNYGNVSNVAISTSYGAEVTPTQKTISLINASECNSGTLFVGISSSPNSVKEFYEMSFLYDGTNVLYDIYARDKTQDLGTIEIVKNESNNLALNYNGISGIGVTIYVNANLLRNTVVNPNFISLDYGRLYSSGIQTTTSSPIGITTFQTDYSSSKFVVEVKKTVGVTTSIHTIHLNCIHYNIDGEKYLNNINYSYLGNIEDLEFNTIFDQGSNTYTLVYYPNTNANYDIKFYQHSILRATNPLL